MMKKKIFVLLLLLLTVSMLYAACAEEPPFPELEQFPVYHGSRESSKIAITMDDAFETEYVRKAVDLCRQYGITMTFFPVGYNLRAEDREIWLDVLEAGCEIGSHTQHHNHIGNIPRANLLYILGRFQENLDKLLGFHYEVRWLRPPFGKITDSKGSSKRATKIIQEFGYDHIVLWDVSEADPDKAFGHVQNGSILLFHARRKDYTCLETLIPRLIEAGYEPVTVSELFGFDPPATGGDLYVFNLRNYE